MADNADIAAEIMEHRLEGAIARARSEALARRYLLGTSPIDCDDCGSVIPEARRNAAPWASTCVECQGIREKKATQRR